MGRGRRHPVPALSHRHLGQFAQEAAPLLVQGVTRRVGSVTPGEDQRPLAPLEEAAAEPAHQGGLPGAADHQVSHRDGRERESARPEEPAAVGLAPQHGAGSEEQRRREEQQTQDRGCDPTPFPGEEGIHATPSPAWLDLGSWSGHGIHHGARARIHDPVRALPAQMDQPDWSGWLGAPRSSRPSAHGLHVRIRVPLRDAQRGDRVGSAERISALLGAR